MLSYLWECLIGNLQCDIDSEACKKVISANVTASSPTYVSCLIVNLNAKKSTDLRHTKFQKYGLWTHLGGAEYAEMMFSDTKNMSR